MLAKTPTCPACGQTVGVAPIHVDLSTGVASMHGYTAIDIPRHQSLILHELVKAGKYGRSHARLHFACYGDRIDGGPAEQVIETYISRLRSLMRDAGWPLTIRCKRYVGYFLVPA